MLISIVGIDGSGKTTQVEMLKKCETFSVKTVKASPVNKTLMESLESLKFDNSEFYNEALSVGMTLDFVKTYKEVIDSSEGYDLIVWDRYTYCIKSYLYAQKYYCEAANYLMNEIKNPDLIIWLKINPKKAEERIIKRNNRKKLENAEFLTLVQEQYGYVLKDIANVVAISCDDMSPQEVHNEIISAINRIRAITA
jgi:dTMP kinase